MRAQEFITTEAISATQYKDNLISAIYEAVRASFEDLYQLKPKLKNTRLEKILNDDEAPRDNEFTEYIKNEFTEYLKEHLTTKITKSLNDSFGEKILYGVYFSKLLSSKFDAVSRYDQIDVQYNYLNDIVKPIMKRLFDIVYDSYFGNETIQGFWFTCRAISSNDPWTFREFTDIIETSSNRLVSVIIHEMVHIIQHYRQKDRYRQGKRWEFRSYLDRYKGDYLDTRKEYDKLPDGDDKKELKGRYARLYYASPQEIAAFAHEAALTIIRDFGFDDKSEYAMDYLINASSVKSRDISDAIDKEIGSRFREPKNPKEAMVRKRYLKLVYQEVMRYIEQRIAKLQKK